MAKNNNHLYQNKVQETADWKTKCSEEDSDIWKELTQNLEENGTDINSLQQHNSIQIQTSSDKPVCVPQQDNNLSETEQSKTNIPDLEQPTIDQDKEIETNDGVEDVYEDDPVSKLRGVRYDTCVQSVNPALDVDKVLNIAPGENKQPISILMDANFEEMALPHLLPHGKFGWKYKRKIPLSAKKYFQKRILDANSSFAQDIEYLFVAQTITITAGLLTDSGALHQIIFKDQAYRFLQPVRGTPPYWQKVQYKLLAAIKQLGIFKSRKENPQKPTQLSSRSHPRHLVGKRTAQKTPS